jgi:predicted hotdog family 3-hydroxylacyl-ACP dehydratase
MRLRQLVLPGDQLELSTRMAEEKGLRFDLKRDGVLVANGELGFGSLRAASNAWTPPQAVPAPSAPRVDELLPQRPPMRFVTGIIGETADGLVCEARIPAGCALVRQGVAPAFAALEAAAQTAAAWEAVRRAREGGRPAPRMGYLVGLRDVSLFARSVAADEALVASIRLEAAALPLTHYAVRVLHSATPILQGRIATYLPPEGA